MLITVVIIWSQLQVPSKCLLMFFKLIANIVCIRGFYFLCLIHTFVSKEAGVSWCVDWMWLAQTSNKVNHIGTVENAWCWSSQYGSQLPLLAIWMSARITSGHGQGVSRPVLILRSTNAFVNRNFIPFHPQACIHQLFNILTTSCWDKHKSESLFFQNMTTFISFGGSLEHVHMHITMNDS